LAEAAARALGLAYHLANASNEREIDTAFANLAERRVGALLVNADAFYSSRREQFGTLTARHAMPAMHQLREFVAAGGLMSYGASITDAFRQAAAYAGRILKGAKPADLPVVQSTKFELVINLKTAKALGLTEAADVASGRRRGDRIIVAAGALFCCAAYVGLWP
jgi:putative ABC transport system substrate-binding protein